VTSGKIDLPGYRGNCSFSRSMNISPRRLGDRVSSRNFTSLFELELLYCNL